MSPLQKFLPGSLNEREFLPPRNWRAPVMATNRRPPSCCRMVSATLLATGSPHGKRSLGLVVVFRGEAQRFDFGAPLPGEVLAVSKIIKPVHGLSVPSCRPF